MKSNITIKDVAMYANVSPATVSLVINNRSGVSTETKNKVLFAINKLNYKPNQAARNLIMQRPSAIGLVVTNIENPFYSELIHYVQEEVDNTEYSLLLGISNDSVKKEIKAIEDMVTRDVGGLIIVPSRDGEDNLHHLYALKELQIPFVFITSAYNGIQSDCIMSDLEKGMYDATMYLLRKNKRKIYFITEKRILRLSEDRIRGYIRAYKECDLKYNDEYIIETNPTVESGIKITQKILEHDTPDAIITVNALLSLGVMKCIKDKELSVPENISVICFDELSYSSLLYTPITTVKQPLYEICHQAVSLLCSRIDGNDEPYKTQYYPTEMIIRHSS